MRRTSLLLFMLVAPTATLLPQAPPDLSASERAAMQRLHFLVGEWEGEARITTGPGQQRTLRQTESVRTALEGVVLLIEGAGFDLGPDGTPGAKVFNAYAVVSWDTATGYAMRSWLMSGQEATRALEVSDSGFVWTQEVPRGKTRYTMRLTPKGEWHETGEFTPDGQRWIPVLEMRLTRKP